jgi:GNAT superfamily N-acetyltransferase
VPWTGTCLTRTACGPGRTACGPGRTACGPRADGLRPRADGLRPRARDLRFRAADRGDAPAVAGLHADSWRRHYRGAFSDAFLDRDVAGYLLPLWTERLATPDSRARTILAEDDGELVGLAHTILDEDATWGALLDNLHVRAALKRQGIGSRLLALTGQAVLDWNPASGLYLWVLEQNSAARAFYAARGAIFVERDDVSPPGDDPANLNGNPITLRYAWRDPSILLPAGERPTLLPR